MIKCEGTDGKQEKKIKLVEKIIPIAKEDGVYFYEEKKECGNCP